MVFSSSTSSNVNKTVLKFEYKRNTPPDIQDASYSEIIYIEIENNSDDSTNKE